MSVRSSVASAATRARGARARRARSGRRAAALPGGPQIAAAFTSLLLLLHRRHREDGVAASKPAEDRLGEFVEVSSEGAGDDRRVPHAAERKGSSRACLAAAAATEDREATRRKRREGGRAPRSGEPRSEDAAATVRGEARARG